MRVRLFALASLMLIVGVQPAAAFCVFGFGNALECRFLAACKKKGASSGSCSCSFDLAKQTFQGDQLAVAVDLFEAHIDGDKARQSAIAQRVGAGAADIASRLNAFVQTATAQCKGL